MRILDAYDARAAALKHLNKALEIDAMYPSDRQGAISHALIALACMEARHIVPVGPIARDQ